MQFKSTFRVIHGSALFVLCIGWSCKKSELSSELPEDYLASYSGDIITMSDIEKVMPAGLNPDDSTRFVRAYVTTWIQTKLIEKDASSLINMDEINHLVDEYRRDLIMTAYRRTMYEHNSQSVDEDSIRKYYEAHKDDFILERPMVKGTYLKVPDDAKNLKTLRRLYKSDKANDADRLEKEVLSSAIHYDYFRDKWVDWEQIETKIPEDFGTSADQWLSKHQSLDKSVGGFTYLLYIVDVLPSGSPMPIEAARSQIVNRLLNINRPEYDSMLLNELYQKALSDKRLIINLD